MQLLGTSIRVLLISLMVLSSCSLPTSKSSVTASELLGKPEYQAICYGGYRANTRDIQPSVAQIKEDLRILQAAGFKLIRSYNTKLDEIRNTLKAINELKKEDSSFEMYLMLGVWIDCENAWTNKTPNHDKENLSANTAEIERAVSLAKEYPEIVKIISVGNEAMVHWASSYYVKPGIILKWVNYLQDLKKRNIINKDIWITSSDNYASWGGGDDTYHVLELVKLFNAVDYVSVHTYPMHDTHYNPIFWGIKASEKTLSKQEQVDSLMKRAVNYAKLQYKSVQAYMKSIGVNKPIHIGETGWASNSDGFYGNEGSQACDEYKAGKYVELMRQWTNKEGITCFYFEAFDEHWKDSQNPKGSENNFGLFTMDGHAKFAMWKDVEQGKFKGLTRDGNKIVKTYEGEIDKLLKEIKIPEHSNK